jgi:hypothetical protein
LSVIVVLYLMEAQPCLCKRLRNEWHQHSISCT